MTYAKQRACLYALSIANTVGRTLGLKSAAYNAQQNANATYIYHYFSSVPGGSPLDGIAVCGNTDGEVSLILTLRGDKSPEYPQGGAGGMSQWHHDRQQLILHYKKIDVWKQTDVINQCTALHAEMSEDWSHYRKVLPALQAAKTLEAKIAVLVTKEEQSGSQARDIARRTMLAQHWAKVFNVEVAA